jgi:hypothetical protein
MKGILKALRDRASLLPAIQANRFWSTSYGCLALVLLLCPVSPKAWAAVSVDDLTGPWHLLVDDYPVLSRANVARTYHAFQKYTNNPVLVADQPWEGLVYLYGTVLPNETRTGYRMWYHTLRPSDTNNDGSLELYATSTDGIHWTKPILNLRSWHGSTANNMFFTRATAGGMTSVMYTPWDPNTNQLYKLMNFDSGGFYGAWSPDGIQITDAPNNPVFTGGSDVGQFSWDPHTQLYRGYVKNAWYDWNGLKRRAVALTTTTNIASWPQESLILWPDAYDDRWIIPGSVQRTHFYGLSAFAYESMYVGFLWIFRATELDGEMPGYLIGPCFVELVSSHDGVHWTRQEGTRPPILALGPNGAWDDGMVFTARAPIVEGDTIKLWYGGFDQVHGSSLKTTTGSIGLATLRKDGFASLDAGATNGAILTKPLTNTSGALQVNYRALGGSLKVEVLDENNTVLPGYSQADCVALTGDSVTQTVAWATHTALPAGAPRMSLRFILQNASLYSFMAGQSAALVDVPTLTQQPASQTIAPGGTASFTVGASAISPLSYQWQKNQVNLSNGGHLLGCTTSTLTISSAASADVAAYRCVVTNAYGNAISSPATLAVVSNIFGMVAVIPIPLLAGDANNEARAITPDGRYVVGLSGTNNGFFYDSVSNRVVRPVSSDGPAAQIVTGVGYRTDLNAQQEVVASGISAGWFTVWMTANGGVTWSPRVSVAPIKKTVVPVANGLAGTSSDVFYSVWMDEGPNTTHDNWAIYIDQFSGAWPMTPEVSSKSIGKPATAAMDSICSKGRAVGWQKAIATNASLSYVADFNGAASTLARWNVYGLDGTTTGEAFSVSADGTVVFGMSPLVVGGATNNYGYKVLFNATFPGPATQLSTNQLPNFPDTTGSPNLATPYGCSADGKYAVGMNYRGIEKAVLWDTSHSNPTNWTITDLTDLAVASGSQGIFGRLARAYSIGTNAAGNLVITGVGYDSNSPANTRAFLMTVSPPSSVAISRPTVTISGSYAAGFTFNFVSVASSSVMYYLECTTNLPGLSNWSTIAATPGTGGVTSLSDPDPPDSRRFYRIRAQ